MKQYWMFKTKSDPNKLKRQLPAQSSTFLLYDDITHRGGSILQVCIGGNLFLVNNVRIHSKLSIRLKSQFLLCSDKVQIGYAHSLQ